MGSTKQVKDTKTKASASSKKNYKPETEVKKGKVSNKAIIELPISSHSTMKAKLKSESKKFQKKNAPKKGSKNITESETASVDASASEEKKPASKKRTFGATFKKAGKTVDSSDEENEESDADLDSEDEKEILDKLDIEDKDDKPEKEAAFTGFSFDSKTNDLSVSIKEKLDKQKVKSSGPVGVVFVGRLPSGFEEFELGKFFGQYGDIMKLRLSRNRRTGNTRHYAFIQYASLEVAKIVAESVNNYLIYGRLLKCQVVPKENVHQKMFWGAKPTLIKFVQKERRIRTLPKTKEQVKASENRNSIKKKKLEAKLQGLGIDYDLSNLDPSKSTPKTTKQSKTKASPKTTPKNKKKSA